MVRSLATAFLLLLLLPGCKENTAGTTDPPADTAAVADTVMPEAPAARPDMVIADIPFPFEILEQLLQRHIPYNSVVMNPTSRVNLYSQYNQKALNLGVYGADLSYVVTYEQFQQIGAYIKATKRLADELQIPLAFDQKMMERYDLYGDNKDSLAQVVYESYDRVDRALRGDERKGMAALVVTGSWLEGLYIATRTFVEAEKNEENSSLYKTISKQRKSLGIVVRLLAEYKEDPFFSALIVELQQITSEYDQLDNQRMSERQLVEIHKKVEKLRDRIVKGL